MHIDSENCMIGNEAMASVLLLYFQIVSGGGFSGDETVFLDQNKFDGYRFLDVEVEESYQPEIDERLIRQGAVICLLCDLNDMISEFDDCYLSHDITKKILAAFSDGKLTSIPEAEELIKLVSVSEVSLDYRKYRQILDSIYCKYVIGTFKRLVHEGKP